jgi:hypothetical protein
MCQSYESAVHGPRTPHTVPLTLQITVSDAPRLRRRVAAEACSPADLGSAETTNRRESLCLNAYPMNHWSRSSIRVCLAGVASTAGCRAEMTTSSRWRPSVTEWPQAWRITRLTTCRPRQTLRRQEFPKQSTWRSEGYWATPQSTRRTADFARENLTRQPSVPAGQAPRGRQTLSNPSAPDPAVSKRGSSGGARKSTVCRELS